MTQYIDTDSIMLAFMVLSLLQCQGENFPCNVTRPCCPNMVCYESTACVHKEDIHVVQAIYRKGYRLRVLADIPDPVFVPH